jgi:hypothetical protein
MADSEPDGEPAAELVHLPFGSPVPDTSPVVPHRPNDTSLLLRHSDSSVDTPRESEGEQLLRTSLAPVRSPLQLDQGLEEAVEELAGASVDLWLEQALGKDVACQTVATRSRRSSLDGKSGGSVRAMGHGAIIRADEAIVSGGCRSRG